MKDQDGAGVTFLMADDDREDCLLSEHALRQACPDVRLRFVHDGEELLHYLRGTGRYAAAPAAPLPGLILLDLNMPRVTGMQALREIKADPALRHLPVVVFTTSQAREDVDRSYDLGVSAFVTKPMSFDGLAASLGALGHFYLQVAELPGGRGRVTAAAAAGS